MTSARGRSGAPERVARRAATEPVPVMGALLVVELHEGVLRPLPGGPGREVLAPELDAPMLVQDGALQPLDEAVRPGMARGASACVECPMSRTPRPTRPCRRLGSSRAWSDSRLAHCRVFCRLVGMGRAARFDVVRGGAILSAADLTAIASNRAQLLRPLGCWRCTRVPDGLFRSS
jgi:hypothetical protein